MSTPIFFQGEVQFRRYSDTSTQGQQVVFALADRESLAPFIGKEGKRFMAVLVEIGDDEQPVRQPEPEKPAAPKGGPLARLAGQWCNDEAFRVWLSKSAALPWSAAWDDYPEAAPAQIAALVVRQICGVKSRAELDSNDAAAMRFQELIRLPYMQHCGVAA